ncbi:MULTISPECIES: hypothetical protein [Corynebacterium]|uniref:Uncharacterized protein n=1 Tax=Corynebacterium minutissimum TaxID=38301 RepID=A0A2X4UDW2_9CORY|nr:MULTISPECIES: hypothetical protein [Corynebacterium]KHO29956.1 hypothetical protein NX84_03685 [Corynebacterium minutissimum]MCQ9676100.1 hypothetical protein [Corynebacterium sp. BF-R-2]QPS60434.1 hypothetical protein I6G51_04355 [Corynebacterium minutissimum]QQA78777.1 hypothetical protein I6H49_08500 [Corynebacterium minutissimum]QRP60210.1 hypothetical protein I6J26_08400 [Corynebacterium minutissimum]
MKKLALGAVVFSGVIAMQQSVAVAQERPHEVSVEQLLQVNGNGYESNFEAELEPYKYSIGAEMPLIDVERAKEDGLSSEAIQVAIYYNDIVSHDYGSGPRDRASLADRWNWCGKYRTGGNVLNSADGVCKRHDLCLANAGNQRAAEIACDNQFIDGMNKVKGSYRGADRVYIEAAILAIKGARVCRPGC